MAQGYSLRLSWWATESGTATAKPWWVCIHSDYAAGTDYYNGFALVYKQVGKEIGCVPVPFKTLEKNPQLVQLSKLQPDFAYAFFPGAEAAVFVQDYYRFKLHAGRLLVKALAQLEGRWDGV